MVRKKTPSHSPSSSIDSSNHPLSLSCTRSESSSCSSSSSSSSSSPSSFCHSSNSKTKRRDLSTDLRLGLSISPSNSPKDTPLSGSPPREQRFDWPPIKPLLRSALAGKIAVEYCRARPSYFVKVYMEGVPIGRKLDLFAHDGYDDLVTSLSQMFRTPIQCPNESRSRCDKAHVLTYEDKEGDWMMVGDVPWEMFVITVKRLKITRADRC